MYRKYLDDLLKWKKDSRRKPLMVWSARQVGKSYLIKELFAEAYYKNNYVFIDCRTDYNFVNYCLEHVNPEDILKYLSLDKGVIINEKSLLIFDEAKNVLSELSNNYLADMELYQASPKSIVRS
ncbi:MAG: AAA family ATPase [Bacilli bacterium]